VSEARGAGPPGEREAAGPGAREDGARAPFDLSAAPLDAASFAPFGRVLDVARLAARPVNEGRGVRIDVPFAVEHDAGAARPATAIYRLTPSALPFVTQTMEHHPRTAQAFLPTRGSRYLVVVAPARADGSPDAAAARAFVATADQAVVYAPGVWHLPLVVLDADAAFLMQMWETGGPDDCHEHRLAAPLRIDAPPA